MTLLSILRQMVSENEQRLQELNNINNSALILHREEIEELQRDITKIIDIDMKVIEKILDEAEVSALEKDAICRYMDTIKKLLTLNKEKHTTFRITVDQMKYVDAFFEKVQLLAKKNEELQTKNLKDMGRLTRISNEYKRLLEMLEDKNNTTYITDIELVMQLLEDNDADDETKKKVLLSIIKYNQQIHNRNKANHIFNNQRKTLPKEEVKKLFASYGYDFEELKVEEQEQILNFGVLTNMKDILECLKMLQFPKFPLKTNSKKLIAILINGNPDVLRYVVEFSHQKGIKPHQLWNIMPAIVPQTTRKERKEKKSNALIIAGRSDDFVENVNFLQSIGYDIHYVLDRCKEILIMSHQKLVDNYQMFIEYGFTHQPNQGTDISDLALSCFLSSNFAQLLDQFIEICPQGYDYVRENRSILNKIASPEDIIFYNIYASNMTEDETGKELIPEGPFVFRNVKNLQLRSEITRFSNGGYYLIPYRGIEDENKKEKTMTIKPMFEKQKEMEEALEKAKEESLPNIIEEKDLEILEEYTDPNCPLRYNIDGVLISKPKVRRVLNILKNYLTRLDEECLLFAMTYNSIINQTSFELLKNKINGRRK